MKDRPNFLQMPEIQNSRKKTIDSKKRTSELHKNGLIMSAINISLTFLIYVSMLYRGMMQFAKTSSVLGVAAHERGRHL